MTTDKSKNFFRVSAEDFKKIPGSPIAYWVSPKELNAYQNGIPLREYATPRQGFATGDNERFLRQWSEVSLKKAWVKNNSKTSYYKWYPCNKGGGFRRWFGNNNLFVNWENDGWEMKNFAGSVIRNPQFYFKEGMTWSTISSFKLSMRYSPAGFLFEKKGSVCFPQHNHSLI